MGYLLGKPAVTCMLVITALTIATCGCKKTTSLPVEPTQPSSPISEVSKFYKLRGGEQYTFTGSTTLNVGDEERVVEITIYETVSSHDFEGAPAFIVEYKVEIQQNGETTTQTSKELLVQRSDGQLEQAKVTDDLGELKIHNPLIVAFPASPEVGWEIEQTSFDEDGTRLNLRSKIIGKQSVVFNDSLVDSYHVEDYENGEKKMDSWFAPSLAAPIMFVFGQEEFGVGVTMKLTEFRRAGSGTTHTE